MRQQLYKLTGFDFVMEQCYSKFLSSPQQQKRGMQIKTKKNQGKKIK